MCPGCASSPDMGNAPDSHWKRSPRPGTAPTVPGLVFGPAGSAQEVLRARRAATDFLAMPDMWARIR